jgi:hypothetical protein
MMFVIELWWYQLHNKAMQESEKRRLLWGETERIASIMAAARATVLLFNKDISISQLLLVRFLWNIEMWVHNDDAARVSIGGRENIKYLAHAQCHVSKKKQWSYSRHHEGDMKWWPAFCTAAWYQFVLQEKAIPGPQTLNETLIALL